MNNQDTPIESEEPKTPSAKKIAVIHADETPEVPAQETPEVVEEKSAEEPEVTVDEVDQPEVVTEETPQETPVEPAEINEQPAETASEEAKPEDTIDLHAEEPEATPDKELDEILESEPKEESEQKPEEIEKNEAPKESKEEQPKIVNEKKGFTQKIKHLLSAWWNNHLARYGSIAGVLAILAVLAIVPAIRYAILNAFGTKVSMSLTVLDEKNSQPIRGVEVIVGSQSSKTDNQGKATLKGLRLGKTSITVKKQAYAQRQFSKVLGWGSNPLGDFKLTSTGSRFSFELTDWLTKKPMNKGVVEITYKESTATNNDLGVAELAIEPTEDNEILVKISSPHYQTIDYKLSVATKDTQKVVMTSDDRHYYMSKRTGKYDLYSSYLDGSDEKLLLAGTGKERDDITLSVNNDASRLALVSTRDGERNKDGYAKSGLYMFNLKDKTAQPKRIALSERVQLVGWFGQRLVYVRVAEGVSDSNPSRHRLVSYDPDAGELEIAASNYFNDVLATNDYVFYAPSNAYQENKQPYLYRVKADGSDKQKIMDKEVWNLFRSDYDTLVVAYQQDWYSIGIKNKVVKKLDGQPNNLLSRLYSVNQDGTKALWLEQRDGRGTLLMHDVQANKDNTVLVQGGLSAPFYFVRDQYIVYRLSTPSENADYIMPVGGDKGVKIKDVSATSSIDRWYYY